MMNMEVISNISMKVNEGEVVAILGPSGSGKSTLLRCMTMLEKLDGGTLEYASGVVCEYIDGKAVYSSKDKLHEIKTSFGLVFQNFNLFPHYTVLKNIIDAPVSVQKRNKEEVIKEARELLKKVGLEDKENAYPCQLSGGQQQRLCIARALAMKPDVLLMDEPTSALDPIATKHIEELLVELKKDVTILIVTHNMGQAQRISERSMFMYLGELVEYGDTAVMFSNPADERTKAYLTGKMG